MQRNIQTDLVTLCDAFAAHRGVTHWRVSALAHGDGQFFKRLKDGKGLTIRVAERVMNWFSNNWPADLPWPSDVPRPERAANSLNSPKPKTATEVS